MTLRSPFVLSPSAACRRRLFAWMWVPTVVACSSPEPSAQLAPSAHQPLIDARCTVDVIGTGVIDVETDYLPHVIQCENGSADFEALKAQAVAARSYLYYRLATGDGTIRDGQSDQVYSCGRTPTAEHIQAVADTEGEVLRYKGTQVAAFYVAGAVPSDRATCIAAPGDNDYSDTEDYVTYNWETTGTGVTQTTLGWVNDGNHANRGCKSQNGAHCLAEAGWTYEDILLFYYGADIKHVQAVGSCAVPTTLPHGCGVVALAADHETIVDDNDACFVKACAGAPGWGERAVGIAGHAWVMPTTADEDTLCTGRWRLSFEEAGTYDIDVHIPDVAGRAGQVHYRVVHAGVEDDVTVAHTEASGWVTLGSFDFDAGSFQYVEVDNLTGAAGSAASGPFAVLDAVRIRNPRVAENNPSGEGEGEPPPDDGGNEGEGEGEGEEDVDDDDSPLVDPDDTGPDRLRPQFAPSVAECACVRVDSALDIPAFALAPGVLLYVVGRRRRPSSADAAPPGR